MRVNSRSRRRLTRPAGLLAALVAVAGCGLRAPSAQVHAATQAAVNGGGGQGGNGSSSSTGSGSNGGLAAGSPSGESASGATGGGGTVTGSSGSSGATPGASGASSGSGSAVAASNGSGPAVGAAAPSGGNGGATDVGVTADTITVGNISDLGGPVPGLFQGGPYGTQAYFNYVNSQGGIYGRKLKLASADDSLQCSQNEAAYQNMVGQVFGFVGSWSLDDSCGAQIMSQHATVPMVQQSLSTQMQNLPNSYSIMPYQAGAQTGYFEYFKQKFPDAITSVGTVVGNQPAAVQSWHYFKAAMESVGYKVTYEDDVPPAQTNFTADVIRMKAAGVKMVFLIALNAPDAAFFSQEAAQQGFKPEVFAAPIAYFASYVSQSGGAASVEGQYVPVVQAQFLGEDASTVPEVALFDQWIKQAYPSFAIDQFAASSWSQAALFVQALKAAGPQLTRQKVLAALAQIHTFNDNGMVAPTDIAAKAGTHCYILLQIKGGKYVRVDDPPTGYRCDGAFFRVG